MRVSGSNLPAAVAAAIVMASAIAGASAPAAAQSMTPMRGQVGSVTDKFAVRVFPMNPNQHRARFEVKVYDENFAPVAAVVSPPAAIISPNGSRNVLVVVPFEGRMQRKVRICTESIAAANATTRLRTQVCGRFIGYRRG